MLKKSTKNTGDKKVVKKSKGNENIENLLKKQTADILDVMDKRFDESDKKSLKLEDTINKRFETVDKRFDTINKRFETVDKRFDTINKRFEGVDKRFDTINKRFEGVDKRFDTINKRFDESEAKADQRFDRIMTNLDLILKRITDTDDEIEFIKLDINRIKEVVKEKLGVNLM